MKAHIAFTTTVLCALCLLTPGHATGHILCPPADDVVAEGSPCPSECYEDRQCQTNSGNNNTLCCPSTTCGQQCVTALNVPFHPPALGCPEIDEDVIGACVEDCNTCSTEELCCSNGCGHVCKTAVLLTPICQGILDSHGGSFMPGEYIPQCNDDGSFAPAQCHGSTGYCWCVRPDTGGPVGRSMTRFQQPQCNNCSFNGQVYYPGDSFPNDCNTCFCSENGAVGCTEIACYLPDTEPPVTTEPPDSTTPPDYTSPYRSCPVLEEGIAGICTELCNSNADCNTDQKCCSNGCGHACMDTVPIPYVPPTRECPPDDGHAICDIQECTDSCENSQLCCQNVCGSRLCVDGVLPPYPCTATVNSLTGGAMLGQFIPQCNEQDGSFLGLQCFSHYCWCVDTASGEPTSDMRESGNLGDLECARCEYEGKTFNHNEVVEQHGDCSTKKTCLGGEIVLTGCSECEYGGQTYEHGEYTDKCRLCVCLDGGVACAQSDAPCPNGCFYNGDYHNPGDSFPSEDGCNTCTCTGGSVDSDDDLKWWHYFLIGAGSLIALLTVVAIGLLVVMVVLIRKGQFRHKRLPDSSDSLSLEHDTQVFFKSGPPEAESVELKVPVEDDGDPIKT